MNPNQEIDLTAGAIEYTWPTTITELTGEDISADVLQISLGSQGAPGTWVTPDKTATGTITALTFRDLNPGIPLPPATTDTTVLHWVSAQMLIGSDPVPALGDYYPWIRLADNPEVVPRRGNKICLT